MRAFIYNGRTYLRLIPGKRMFQSTMVHEVVNRGDVFGMDIETQQFTVIPGKAQVEHIEMVICGASQSFPKAAPITSSQMDILNEYSNTQ